MIHGRAWYAKHAIQVPNADHVANLMKHRTILKRKCQRQCPNCCVNNEHNLQFCPCCSTPKAGNHPGNSTKAGMDYDIILIC